MRTFTALLFSMVLVTTSWAVGERGEPFIPKDQWVTNLMGVFYKTIEQGKRKLHSDEYAVKVDEEGDPGNTFSAYFFLRGPHPAWTLSTRTKRANDHGFDIESWEYSLQDPTLVVYTRHVVGVTYSRDHDFPKQNISPNSPEWNKALAFSEKAWEMLCQKVSCEQ